MREKGVDFSSAVGRRVGSGLAGGGEGIRPSPPLRPSDSWLEARWTGARA